MSLLSVGPRPGETVPIFPLATVLYPGMRLPLKIFEPRYMDMAKACLKHDAAFGVCLIREGEEVGTPAVPESVGCLARIAEWDMETPGILKVKVEWLERFRLGETKNTAAGLRGPRASRSPTATTTRAGSASGSRRSCRCAWP